MNSLDYSPDIVDRIETLSRKATDKKKVLQDFVDILQDLARLEDYFSRNVEKISESLTRLIHGKDQLKEIFMILRNFLTIQAEQSRSLARSLKNEVADELQQILATESPWQKDTQLLAKKHSRDVKLHIDKLNQLRNQYFSAVQQEQQRQKLNIVPKQKTSKSLKLCEDELREYVDNYNKQQFQFQFFKRYIDIYFSDIAIISETFTKMEVERRLRCQDAAMKLLMFEVSMVRNLQYDLTGITQKMEVYNPKQDIQDLFKESPSDKPLLCKLNFLNYLAFLNQQLNFTPENRTKWQQQQQQNLEVQKEEQENNVQTNKQKIFSNTENQQPSNPKQRRLIFSDNSQQSQAPKPPPVNDGSNPIISKMFQNALFNNVITDGAILTLIDLINNDRHQLKSMPISLEKILQLSVNQSIDHRVEVQPTGYVSLLKICQCFFDAIQISEVADMVKMLQLCSKIYKRVDTPDGKNVEQTTVRDGVCSYHQVFQNYALWLELGKMEIQQKVAQFRQSQESTIFNELEPLSEPDFIIKEILLYLQWILDQGCNPDTCNQVKVKLMQELNLGDELRERIYSEALSNIQKKNSESQVIVQISEVRENLFENVLS